MKFNASKCKVLTITRNKSPVITDYRLGNVILQRAHQEKDWELLSKATYPGILTFSQSSVKPTRCLVS
jgi:hypothetical protein